MPLSYRLDVEEGQECLGTENEKKDTVFKYCHIYLNVCVCVCVCVSVYEQTGD